MIEQGGDIGFFDRLVWIDCGVALIWINATPEEFGTEWQ
jgi:hypothetical protein